ncbi:MAG TPA: cell division protein CrgA [Actinomycetota bacterium]|nr:cell division protein CrgA [Actinomycetota bacterium]
MPRSKSKRTRRQPAPKPKPKKSPPWVGGLFFALLLAGIVTIIAHYLGGGVRPFQLWVGLGLITGSFIVATQWH